MAILQSCCFWKSLRRGAYASVVYTFLYFGGIFILESDYLYMEREFLTGAVDTPKGESFLERNKVSYSSVIFSILLFICSACGVIACLLVFLGLAVDRREFLMPWMVVMVLHIALELLHFIYLLILDTLHFEPVTAIMYTIDFFLFCLNIYCLLCILSQYQEYKAGRGCDRHIQSDVELRTESVRYLPPQSTENQNMPNNRNRNQHDKCISTKHHVLTNSIFSSSSTNRLSLNSPIERRRSSNMLKKHVQFPEDFKCVEEEEILFTNNSNVNGSDQIGIDSPPSAIVSMQY